MTDMSRDILTCYLDFNVYEDFDVSNGYCLAEFKLHLDLVEEFANILSKFLVSELIRSRGPQYFIDANIDVGCLSKGVIAVTLRWRDGVALIDADVIPGVLVNMLSDAIEILVVERDIPGLTYKIGEGVDCLYKIDLSGETAVCQFRNEEMASIVNKIEKFLVNLNKLGDAAELHLYSETGFFQIPPLESRRHFMDIKESIEEEIECVAFATEMRGENRAFKITITGKGRQYYLDDVSSEAEEQLARDAKYNDKIKLLVRPVRSVKRGVVGQITRYSLAAYMDEQDGGQQWIRLPDVKGRRH